MEICEELRKRKGDVCGLQEVRWDGKTKVLDFVFFLDEGINCGGLEILVKKELCEKVVDVRKKSDRVMTVVLAFGKQVIRVISAYGPQAGRPLEEKHRFYDELAAEYELQNPSEIILGQGDFNGHIGEEIEGFEDVHEENGIGKRNAEGRMLLEFCYEIELYVANTWICGKHIGFNM